MTLFYKSILFIVWSRLALGTIPGLSYMDPIRQRPLDRKLPGEDPCNPLYWYPREIPEYCYFKPPITITNIKKPPLPVPLPVPVPQPLIIPGPYPPVPVPFPIMPPTPPIMPPMPPIMPPMPPIMPPPAVPIAVPPFYAQPPVLPTAPASPLMAYDTNLQTYHQYPYPVNVPQAGLVPGLSGLVTKDGGINIMPFSDAYSDMLENHKNKMIRKKLQRIINEYEHFPNSRNYLRLKKFNRFLDL